jgi:hypothetical protein
MSQQNALLVALNALQAIDEDHPYPIAKHAIEQINKALAQPEPWVSLSDRDITGAAHTEARHPVSILGTTDSGLCMQFSETGEWHASDKHGDFMKVNSFLMSFARAVEAELRSKNT